MISVSLLLNSGANASHIVGGEMNLTHVEENEYDLYFEIYRDCYHGVPDFNDPVTIGMFDRADHELVNTFTVDLLRDDSLDFVDEGCMDIPENCNHTGVYQKRIELNPAEYNSDAGYYFSWERCCRNVDIDNIYRSHPNPYGSEGIAFYMEIPSLNHQPSTPGSVRDPLTLLCAGNTFEMDFSAYDPDGDSLVYSITEPLKGNLTHHSPNDPNQADYPVVLSGPYDPVNWQAGYGIHNIMDSDPPLEIDPQTGEVFVSPQQQGIFAVAIQIDYFRNGERLGKIIRELQFTVTSCNQNNPPEISDEEEAGIILEDTVFEVHVGQILEFPVLVKDPDPDDSVFVYFRSELLGGPDFSPPYALAPDDSGFNETETFFRWEPSCEQVRDEPYQVSIFAEDNGCPQSMRTQTDIQIRVLPPPEINPPEILCLERLNDQTKRIEWSGFNPVDDHLRYLANYTLIKEHLPTGDTEALSTFSDTLHATYTDQDAPAGVTDEYCYYLVAENICGESNAMNYRACSEEDQQEIEPVKIRQATVINNEHIRLSWEPSEEGPFESYMIFRKEKHKEHPYQFYREINDPGTTTFIDENVDVQNIEYCYYIEVYNSCGYQSTSSNPGCQIVLRGTSDPFEHFLSWNPYYQWEEGIRQYELLRKFDDEYSVIATREEGQETEWKDEELEYHEGAYYYKIRATEDTDDNPGLSASNSIYLYQSPRINIPNAFSPNNNGLHEEWEIQPVFVKEINVRIYTRWGELVFQTNEIDDYWDGKVKGALSNENVFIYSITYRGWDGSTDTESGTITLLR